MDSDMTVVYRAADIGEADIVANWLQEQGFAAFVKNEYGAVAFQLPLVEGRTGIGVCVQAGDGAAAAALLEQHREEIDRHKAEAGTNPIQANCEECGKVTTFPASQRGTVQTCSHCGANMDVTA
ncbi:MAG: DUF2007 domain-containing protein [Planctomycetes bacterium]|nr:DUF2007 domain-containing protein [Planctomycetota bacterium]MBI3836123.1 DUF2007 domain-containing protein [Planctomycetota bacterium]